MACTEGTAGVLELVEQALASPSRPELLRRAEVAADCARDRQGMVGVAAALAKDV